MKYARNILEEICKKGKNDVALIFGKCLIVALLWTDVFCVDWLQMREYGF